MTSTAAQLLKRLDPAVRPGFTSAPAARPQAPLEQADFEHLLALASRGSITSGRQVGSACDLQPPLDASQFERLASAADQAEASGSTKALMFIDGRALVLDVASRAIEAELTSTSAAQLFKIDTAMRVAANGETGNGLIPFPGTGILPASMTRNLPIANRPLTSDL